MSALFCFHCFGETIKVVTWNLHNFPSGMINLKRPVIEKGNIAKAAEVIKSINPDVLLLQEIRDEETCQQLANALKPETYFVLACSGFKDNGIVTFQQIAILSKKKALTSGWEKWKTYGLVDPPRGFSCAIIQFGEATLAFYSVHLKSNVTRGTNRERQIQLNILKRELATDQLVHHASKLMETSPFDVTSIIIGGDFNTNEDDLMFASENTIGQLTLKGYINCFLGISQDKRITHPGNNGYPDATFDYIFYLNANLIGCPRIINSSISDHLPVAIELIPE